MEINTLMEMMSPQPLMGKAYLVMLFKMLPEIIT